MRMSVCVHTCFSIKQNCPNWTQLALRFGTLGVRMLYQGTCINQVMSWLGWLQWITWQDLESSEVKLLGTSLRERLHWANWGEKIHPDYRQHASTGWGPRKKQEKNRNEHQHSHSLHPDCRCNVTSCFKLLPPWWTASCNCEPTNKRTNKRYHPSLCCFCQAFCPGNEKRKQCAGLPGWMNEIMHVHAEYMPCTTQINCEQGGTNIQWYQILTHIQNCFIKYMHYTKYNCHNFVTPNRNKFLCSIGKE